MYRSLCILVPISSFPSLYFPSLSIIFLPFTFIISLDNFHVYFPNLFSLFFLPVFSSFFLFFILLDSFHFSLQQFSSPFLYFIPLLPSSFFFNFSINIPSLFDGIHIYICILNIFLFFFLSTKKEEDGGRRGLSKSFAIEKPRKDEDTHLESRRQDLEKGGKKRGDEGRVRFSPSTPIQQTRSPARRISFHPSPSPSAAHVPL